MSDIKFQQSHTLGFDKARELAGQWMAEASQKMGLNCQCQAGEQADTITFERMGVNGTLVVSGEAFDLHIKLGMMMSAFKPMIEAEVTKNLGRILEKASKQG